MDRVYHDQTNDQERIFFSIIVTSHERHGVFNPRRLNSSSAYLG